MFKEFREFIAERNIMDLAIGVIIGGALTTVVKSLVNNLINPLIGIFLSRTELTGLYFRFRTVKFSYGQFINDFLTFILTAFIVFLMLRMLNKAFRLQKKKEEDKNTQLLTEIRDLLEQNMK